MKLIEVDGKKAVLLDDPSEDHEAMWHAMFTVMSLAEDGVSYWDAQRSDEERAEDKKFLERVYKMTNEIQEGLFPGRK